MKYLISAGGTGGHIYPAISIINTIRKNDKSHEILFIGTTTRMEKDIIPQLGIKYIGLDIIGLSKNPLKLVEALYYNLKSYKKSLKIIKDFNPDITIGVGGYVTAPVCLASHKLNVPILLHEQNSIPGKANKMLSKYATVVCLSMENSKKYFSTNNCVYTGNPRGEEILTYPKANKKDYGLNENKKLVLITTGSLGAETVNEKIKEMLKNFNETSYEILFVTGKKTYEYFKDCTKKGVKVVDYLEDMPKVLKITDLIVSRAGATTISEITSLGIPSILIPSPYVANNHQYVNAKDLEDHNACVLIEENHLDPNELLKEINNILNDKEKYDKLKKGAQKLGVSNSATRIYQEILKIVK